MFLGCSDPGFTFEISSWPMLSSIFFSAVSPTHIFTGILVSAFNLYHDEDDEDSKRWLWRRSLVPGNMRVEM